jgi:predicted nucleic acid-binding protein
MCIEMSTDTNIWNDFRVIGRLSLPFRLPDGFHIARIIFEDEMYSHGYFSKDILGFGLKLTEVAAVELQTAQEESAMNPRLSFSDCLAMSIAKNRAWTLLTGDGRLRKAAQERNITVCGTLWIIEELARRELIDAAELYEVCRELIKSVEAGILRLPISQIMQLERKFNEPGA